MYTRQDYIIFINNIYLEHQNIQRASQLVKQLEKCLQDKAYKEDKKTLVDRVDQLSELYKNILTLQLFNDNHWQEFINHFNLFNEQLTQFGGEKGEVKKLIEKIKANHHASLAESPAITLLKEYYITNLFGLKGACSGLSGWWGYTMSERNEKQFSDVMSKIVSCVNRKSLLDEEKMLQNHVALEKYDAHIRWFQEPSMIHDSIKQKDWDIIFEGLMTECSLDKKNNIKLDIQDINAIHTFLKLIPDERLISVGEAGHRISIFKRNNEYVLFDPNHRYGLVEQFETADELASFLPECFKGLHWFGGYVDFRVFSNPKFAPAVKDEEAISLINFFHTINEDRKDKNFPQQLIETAAKTMGTVNLSILESITQKEGAEVASLINDRNILDFAYEHNNLPFIISLLELEPQIGMLSSESKTQLLEKALLDYESPGLLAANNFYMLSDLIQSLLQHGADSDRQHLKEPDSLGLDESTPMLVSQHSIFAKEKEILKPSEPVSDKKIQNKN